MYPAAEPKANAASSSVLHAPATKSPPPTKGRHRFAYRASSSVLGRRFYVAIFIGAEKRDDARLQTEKQQKTFLRLITTTLGFVWTLFFVTVVLLGLGVVIAYLLKSSLGINLFEQHSFLHDYFYD